MLDNTRQLALHTLQSFTKQDSEFLVAVLELHKTRECQVDITFKRYGDKIFCSDRHENSEQKSNAQGTSSASTLTHSLPAI